MAARLPVGSDPGIQLETAITRCPPSVPLARTSLLQVMPVLEPGLTLGEYRNQAMQLFTRLAPVYLQRVKVQMPNGVRFDVVRLDGGALVFRGSDGSFFDFDGTNLRLMQSDVLWFGEGKLMGQEYALPVAYFDASVQSLLVPAKR